MKGIASIVDGMLAFVEPCKGEGSMQIYSHKADPHRKHSESFSLRPTRGYEHHSFSPLVSRGTTIDCGNEESGSLVPRGSIAMHAVEGDCHIPIHGTEAFGISQTMDDNRVADFITVYNACV